MKIIILIISIMSIVTFASAQSTLKQNKKTIETTIAIQASAERVWDKLMKFSEYKNWNPFIKSLKGDVKKGSKIEVFIDNGKQKMTFKPKVLELKKNKEFRWKGKFLFRGLFDGEHYFILEEKEGVTYLTHGERFTGVLSSLFLKMIYNDTLNGFIAMNEALKKQVTSN